MLLSLQQGPVGWAELTPLPHSPSSELSLLFGMSSMASSLVLDKTHWALYASSTCHPHMLSTSSPSVIPAGHNGIHKKTRPGHKATSRCTTKPWNLPGKGTARGPSPFLISAGNSRSSSPSLCLRIKATRQMLPQRTSQFCNAPSLFTVPMVAVPGPQTCRHISERTRLHAVGGSSSLSSSAAQVLQTSVDLQDVAATGCAFLLALVWVRLWDELVARRVVDSKLSRKLVHITTGLLFMLSWPLFSEHVEARYFAATVPAANIVRLALLGLGVTENEAVVKAVSREGGAKELLRGPLFYVITIAVVTIWFWRTSPVGCIALTMMCAGDGIADIVGRNWGSSKLPWNEKKSWAGSIAMFTFGAALSCGFVYLFCFLSFFSCKWWSPQSCLAICTVALAATVVESLPISTKLDDNFTVPLSSILFGLLLMPLM